MYNVVRYVWLHAIGVMFFRSSALADDIKGATAAVNSTTPSTVENEITVHTITVGEKQHFFTPNSINALPGDIVTFRFWPGYHSVIRAEFGYPCVPYEELRHNDGAGFYSGVQAPDAVDVERNSLPTWNLTINTTSPAFFYCGAPGSCVGWGMVGAINADAERPIATQIKLARQAGFVVTPGQSLPADVKTLMDSLPEAASTIIASAYPTSDSRTEAKTKGSVTTSDSHQGVSHQAASSGLPVATVVGIVLGSLFAIVLLIGIFCIKPLPNTLADFFGRFRKRSKYHAPPPTPNTTETTTIEKDCSLSHYTSSSSLHPSLRDPEKIPFSAASYQQATKTFRDPGGLLDST